MIRIFERKRKLSMEKNKLKNARRTRNYATLVYPESAPENWIQILSDQYVSAFVSPLHNQDFLDTGEPKKPHYHVIVMFDSMKTHEQAEELFEKIKGVGCVPVQSIRSYARYLCHLDHIEKAQYCPTEVQCFCGADYFETIALVADRYKTLIEIQDYCVASNLTSYADLMIFCRENRFDWYRVAADNTIFLKAFLTSMQWTDSRR
jgi:hypothetical protein